MKKLLSMILVLAMVFSLAVPALAAEPTVTGDSEREVKASFAPEIAITGLSFEAEGILHDQATNTYTIPLYEDHNESIDYTVVYSGKNLKYFADAKEVLIRLTITTNGTSQTVQTNLAQYAANAFTYDAATDTLKSERSETGEFKVEYQHSNDNGTTWSVPVTIEAKRGYDISVQDNIVHGKVTADKAFAGVGETVTLTVTPDEGYELEKVGYFNADPNVEPIPVYIENNQFVMPEYNVLIYATFVEAAKTYTVTLPETIENGAVKFKDDETSFTASFTAGTTVKLTVSPDKGYELDTLTANDVAVTDIDEEGYYWFTMGNADVEVKATFKKIAYTVDLPGTFDNGRVTIVGDKTSFTEGETVTLKVTPYDGYALDELKVNDVKVTATDEDGNYIFIMGNANVKITATFKKNVFAIKIGNFVGGSVTAVKTAAVGDTVTLTVSTTGKYQLKSITVKDAENRTVGFTESGVASGIYKFIMPASDVTVEATFEEVLTTSADITWGSLYFVYTDGENGAEDGAWSCEDGANKITVKNIGDNAFSATPAYEAKDGFNEISGAFFDNNGEEVDAIAGARLDSGETCDFYLCLTGTPAKALNDVIGEVTVKINSAPAAESAVMYVSTQYKPHYEDPSFYTAYRYVITFYNEAGTKLSDSQVYTEQNVPVPIPDGAASISITLEAYDSTTELWGLARQSDKTALPGGSCNVKYSCGWSGDDRVNSVTITPIN